MLLRQLKTLLEDLSSLGSIPSNPLALVSYDEVEYDLDQLEQKFASLLQKLGFSDIQPEVITFDPNTGDLLIRFTNQDTGESVEVLFTVIELSPIAAVVSQDDLPIEVNFANFNVPLAEYVLGVGIDWDAPLTWLNKSALSALFQAGRLVENYIPVRGLRKERLPLLRKGVPEEVKATLKRIKVHKCSRKGKLRKRRKT